MFDISLKNMNINSDNLRNKRSYMIKVVTKYKEIISARNCMNLEVNNAQNSTIPTEE